jgi:hypothetical protein
MLAFHQLLPPNHNHSLGRKKDINMLKLKIHILLYVSHETKKITSTNTIPIPSLRDMHSLFLN